MKRPKTTDTARTGFWARLRPFHDRRHRMRSDRPTADPDFLKKYADARMGQPRMWL